MSSQNQRRLMAMEELTNGMGFATELLGLLQEDTAGNYLAGSSAAYKIEQAFSSALSVLISDEDAGNDHVQYPSLCTSEITSSSSPDQLSAPPASFNGQTCMLTLGDDRSSHHKRRAPAERWKNLTASPLDDGHGWRKYGQKRILKAEHPRCYFRCTHKDDQGCKASKTVQRIEGQESMYLVSYTGQHTCNSSHHPLPIIVDCPTEDASNMLSFVSNFKNTTTSTSLNRTKNRSSYQLEKQSVHDEMTTNIPFEHISDELSMVPGLVKSLQTPELISPLTPCSMDNMSMEDSIEAWLSNSSSTSDEYLNCEYFEHF